MRQIGRVEEEDFWLIVAFQGAKMSQKSGALRLPRLAGVSEHASQCGVVDGDDRHGKIGDAIDSRDTIARMIPIADVLYDTFISASGAPSFRAGTGRSPHQASRTRRIAESRSDSTLVVARWMHLKILTGFVCHCKLKADTGKDWPPFTNSFV
jgi:hypothetical protein